MELVEHLNLNLELKPLYSILEDREKEFKIARSIQGYGKFGATIPTESSAMDTYFGSCNISAEAKDYIFGILSTLIKTNKDITFEDVAKMVKGESGLPAEISEDLGKMEALQILFGVRESLR